MRRKVALAGMVAALCLLLAGPAPALAQQPPPLADIESEIDAVQWGVVYCPKDGWGQRLESLKLLVLLEVADKLVECAMVEYDGAGAVTDGVEARLSRAVDLLERARGLTEDGGFDISAGIDRAVDTEVFKEEVFGGHDWLKAGDTPWTGDSMSAYSACTTVDSYIDVAVARIGLWLPE